MSPAGVAVTPQNDVVVIDGVHVQKFNAEGEILLVWGKAGAGEGELSRPRGLAVDRQGYIYVADTGNNRVQKFDANGRFIAKWGPGGQSDLQVIGPAAVAVNDKGSVFVVETENSRLAEFKIPD